MPTSQDPHCYSMLCPVSELLALFYSKTNYMHQCLKYIYCYSKINKFEILVHLVGFSIEIYYDARPYESQICRCQTGKGNISI